MRAGSCRGPQRGGTGLNERRSRAGGPGPTIPTGSYVTAVTTREVRDLADLGGASRSLGERWEQVGGTALADLVGKELRAPSGESYRCRAVVQLNQHGGLLGESAGRGLKSPDCLFAGYDRLGRPVLQPGDFKFTLDIATRDQIDPAPIRALLEGGGPYFEVALREVLVGGGTGEEIGVSAAGWLLAALDAGRARLLPGFFLAPDEACNRLFLRQTARHRRGAVRPDDVVFLPVDPATFFTGLPGAEVAPLLREIDGLVPNERDFPAATYYFQLGAAVRGAFELLSRPLLDLLGPAPELNAPARLRTFLARRPVMWAIDIARELARPAIARRERLRLAGRLAGSPLRGRPAYEAAAEAGWQVGDEPGPRTLTKAQLKPLLDQVEAFHNQALADLLRQRLAGGSFADDQAVLDWLREARASLEPRDRAEFQRLLTELAAAPEPLAVD